MFSPFCGHVTPGNGGTRFQFGEASFRPNCHVIRCEHCQQLIPTTTTVAPPHRPTARSQHIPVDPQLIQTHTTQYTPVSVASDTTRGSNVANRTDSFGDFKATNFHNSLLTTRKGRPSSQITVGSGRPLPSSSQRYDSKQRRNRKAKQLEKTVSPLDEHSLSPQLPAVRKYSLKLVITHADTPFKHEVVPDTEEWCPTEEDILYKIGGINLTGYFGDVILQTGLWDSVITMQPECRYLL